MPDGDRSSTPSVGLVFVKQKPDVILGSGILTPRVHFGEGRVKVLPLQGLRVLEPTSVTV